MSTMIQFGRPGPRPEYRITRRSHTRSSSRRGVIIYKIYIGILVLWPTAVEDLRQDLRAVESRSPMRLRPTHSLGSGHPFVLSGHHREVWKRFSIGSVKSD